MSKISEVIFISKLLLCLIRSVKYLFKNESNITLYEKI
jgi:hypothetical protein